MKVDFFQGLCFFPLNSIWIYVVLLVVVPSIFGSCVVLVGRYLWWFYTQHIYSCLEIERKKKKRFDFLIRLGICCHVYFILHNFPFLFHIFVYPGIWWQWRQ